jgi:ketosteroid isomerase-like protein
MNSGPIEDRLAIRELIESFAEGTMRMDPKLWGATWAEDGVWKLPSMEEPARGKAEILEVFPQKMAYVKFMSMIAFPVDIVVEGDTARCRTYCREFIFPKAGGQKFVLGCFEDRLVRRDGQWLFASRIYEIVGMQ